MPPETIDGEVISLGPIREDWRLITVRVNGRSEKWTGVMPAVTVGARVQATGRYEPDRRGKGDVLRVETLVQKVDRTKDAICAYLRSGVIPGISGRLAKRIVDRFGDATLDVLDKEPHRIAELPRVHPDKAAAIARGWADTRMLSAVMIFLLEHGVTRSIAKKIVDEYGHRARWVVENDPYELATRIDGVGFATADALAQHLGLAPDSPERAAAAVVHALAEQTKKGHVYTERRALARIAAALIRVDETKLDQAIDALARAQNPRIFVAPRGQAELVYQPRLYRAEQEVARRLVELATAPLGHDADSRERPVARNVTRAIERFERLVRVKLAPLQRAAVEVATSAKVVVITGGPGTGKTTITRAILTTFAESKVKVLQAAPTGRAAKRMAEATRHKASTIHRLLRYSPETHAFEHDAQKPLGCGALLLDEVSMLDLPLAADLLEAVPTGARLILVGDVDQLPSVGPGAVLREIIDAGVIPTVRLTQIFRQAEGSQITEQAHRINAGEMPVGATKSQGEFYFLQRTGEDQEEAAADTVIELVSSRIQQGFGIAPANIQVLSPMHKGAAGTVELNRRLQATLNPAVAPGTPELVRGDNVLRVGDRVLQQKNDPERDVYNGDLGVVASVDPKGEKDGVVLVARVDERDVSYTLSQVEHLKLAYAMTCHKSQGGQFDAVVVLLLRAHWAMLARNLLYTAVTRGKRLVVLVADPWAVRQALSDARREQRRTMLAELLRERARARAPSPAPRS